MTIAGLPAADLSVLHMQKDCYVTLPKTADISDAQSAISYELPESAPSEAVARIFYQYNDRQIGVSYLLHKVADEETAAAAARSGAALNESGAELLCREAVRITKLMFLRQESRKNLRSVRILWLWLRQIRWLLPGVRKEAGFRSPQTRHSFKHPAGFLDYCGRCCGGGYHWFGTPYGEIPD